MKKTKSIAAIAMAAMMVTSVATTTVSAIDAGYLERQSYSASFSNYAIPTNIYMMEYTSGNASRRAKATAAIDAAKALLARINTADIGNPAAPSFDSIALMVGSTKYDYLIKANAENGATVLTFDSSSNLKSAMTKIKTEEQSIINAALLPYRNYIDTILASGTYTKALNTDTPEAKAAKIANAALLSAAKNCLTYTYSDLDLFSGDVTGSAKTHQIAYLSAATIGTSSAQTVVSNDEEFTNFPKLILNGQTIDWGSVHHLDIFGNSNNSWWFALKDGNTLNNDYYWLKGMMIPDFADTISFDAYAGTEWAQFSKVPNGSNNGGGNGGGNNNNDNNNDNSWLVEYNGAYYYYNASYNYVSDTIYAVTDGYSTFYYPNYAYAKAALNADSSRYISATYTSTHSDYARYFSFVNGNYYTSLANSPYPNNTSYMRGDTTTSTPSTPSASTMNYYYNDGNVYDINGNLIGSDASRGYSSQATWFCAYDGRFYPTAQAGKAGYYVSAKSNSIDLSDPYYYYWLMRIQELQNNSNKNINSTSSSNSSSSNNSSSNKDNNKPSSSDEEIIDDDSSTSISATTLAALRASGETVTIKPLKSATWTISGENVTTPKDINLKITYKTNNIPSALKKAARGDCPYSLTFTVGENLKWGTNASLSIKFAKERANFIAKLYRYDTATSTLVLVNTATVGNTGKVTFNNIDHGGEYFITLG